LLPLASVKVRDFAVVSLMVTPTLMVSVPGAETEPLMSETVY
jgi:hypothetical protein